jgi:hypothetical protein
MLRRAFFLFVLSTVLLFGSGKTAKAQGWTFTETVTHSGPGPCIPYPQLPPIVYYTKDACEYNRSAELSNNGDDWSAFGDGSCILIITCGPCVGSDPGPGPTGSGGSSIMGNPGEVSITGLLTGKSLFSPHDTRDIETWINDFLQRNKSMGISVEGMNQITSGDVPLTGNAGFNKFYTEQMMRFQKPEQGGTVYLKEGQNTIDPNDLKGTGKENPDPKNTTPSLGTVVVPSSASQWYHLEPLSNGGIPPVPVSNNDPNVRYEHPRIEAAREAGITLAGWLPDGAAYPGILAVNIWSENAKAIQDIRDGNAPQDAWTSISNAYQNSLTDIKDQAIGDVSGKMFDKAIDIISPVKGFAELASGAVDLNGKWQDLGGEVAGGEGDGIFGNITKAAGWLGQAPSNSGL